MGMGGRRPAPEMMVALLLYGYCRGERSSRVIEKRCVRDVAYRVITGGLRPDHATIARFRARHEKALGGLFTQVLRLLAAEGMVCLGVLSVDGTKLAGSASQKANKTLPQIEKLLAEAAAVDAAEDAQHGGQSGGSGWPPPETGSPPRTRPAATRSGPGSKPGMRPRRPGNGASRPDRKASTPPAITRTRPRPSLPRPPGMIRSPAGRIKDALQTPATPAGLPPGP